MEERRPVTEHLEKAWGQALLAVSAVEEEAGRWVQRWADAAGWEPEEVRRHAGEWAERLAGQRRELERFMDEGVRRALARLRIPKREEVQELERKIGVLSRRVEALEQRER